MLESPQHKPITMLFEEDTTPLDVLVDATAQLVNPLLFTKGYEGVTQKLRVILHTSPLIRLHTGDTQRGEASNHYDALLLALKMFDLIVENAGLDSELDTDQLLTHLTPTLKRMDEIAQKEVSPEQHAAIVKFLLDVVCPDSPATEEYLDLSSDGDKRRSLPIRLVESWYHPDGRPVLRLSPQALNLFLGALDLDIEDTQVAAEALVKSQLARGKWEQAVQSAHRARAASVQFQAKIEAIVRQTERDVSRLDWENEIPLLLQNAIQHLEERQATEHTLSITAQERLGALEQNSLQAQTVALVLDLIDDCRRRHEKLLPHLMRARDVFLNEQIRQEFRPDFGHSFPCLTVDVLLPLLQLPCDAALACLRPKASFSPPAPLFDVPHLLSWREWLARHLRLGRDEDRETPVEERDLLLWNDDSWEEGQKARRVAQKHIDSFIALLPLSNGVLLSDVLQNACDAEMEPLVLEYLALQAFRAFAPDGDTSADPLAQKTALPYTVEKAEKTLHTAGFGGDDLIFRTTEKHKFARPERPEP